MDVTSEVSGLDVGLSLVPSPPPEHVPTYPLHTHTHTLPGTGATNRSSVKTQDFHTLLNKYIMTEKTFNKILDGKYPTERHISRKL